MSADFPKTAHIPLGYVYFIQAGVDGPIKIGWASGPSVRLQGLQDSHYEKLHLLHYFPGTVADERHVHEQVAAYRIRGEWFKPVVLEVLFGEERAFDIWLGHEEVA